MNSYSTTSILVRPFSFIISCVLTLLFLYVHLLLFCQAVEHLSSSSRAKSYPVLPHSMRHKQLILGLLSPFLPLFPPKIVFEVVVIEVVAILPSIYSFSTTHTSIFQFQKIACCVVTSPFYLRSDCRPWIRFQNLDQIPLFFSNKLSTTLPLHTTFLIT